MKNINKALTVGILAISINAHANTPYIDAIVNEISQLAPGSESFLWSKTEGNQLTESKWLFQTPDCWGNADPDNCTGRDSIGLLANEIEEIIASADNWVDITTLMPWADEMFYDAIRNGISRAYANNNDITFRLLSGRYPLSGNTEEFYNQLLEDLGDVPDIRLFVAGVSTNRYPPLPLSPDSWNHSKIVAADSRLAMVGGINYWNIDYADGPENLPVNDINMLVTGPAAHDTHNFSDLIWQFTCENYEDTGLVHLYSTVNVSEYCPTQHTNSRSEPVGEVTALMIAGAGMGVEVPGGSEGGLPDVDDLLALCNESLGDYTNYNSQYTVLNPGDHALRTMMSLADEHVFISVTVGMAVTRHPLRRSVLALLAHTAPTSSI